MDFSSADNIDELLDLIQQSRIFDNNAKQLLIERIQKEINAKNYTAISKILQLVGFKDLDADRIFRYASGRFKLDNKLAILPYQFVDSIKTFFRVTPEIPNGYIARQGGIIISAFFDGKTISYEANSEYYLFGYKVLIISSIRDAVETLSNYRIDSNKLESLIKLLEPGTNYILDKSNTIIYNVNAILIKVKNPKSGIYLDAMEKLDLINQPYPKKYMINPDHTINTMLLTLINNPNIVHVVNQLTGMSFREGNTDIYTRLGKNVCNIPNIILQINSDNSVIDIQNAQDNLNRMRSIINCQQRYAIIGVGLHFTNGAMNHQIVIILDVSTGYGYLFDPSYYNTSGYGDMYKSIIRYFKQKLSYNYPELNIRSMNDYACSCSCSFQGANQNDIYCISWSFYFSILFLLNENTLFEQIVNYIYSLGHTGLRVVIPRFLIWAFGPDLIEQAIELENQTTA